MANIGFQTQINSQKAYGVAGDFMDGNYNHMYPLTLLVKDGETINIGTFAWDNGDGTCSPTGEGQPTGIVHRTIYLPIGYNEGATMTIPERHRVAIADKCSIFINVTDTPTVGNKIYVNNATGAITNAASGTTVSGASETSFKIVSLCGNEPTEGGLVGVTNWG